jgi:ABC-type dipeptide/oligopeptide/nickel transport system permease subunit
VMIPALGAGGGERHHRHRPFNIPVFARLTQGRALLWRRFRPRGEACRQGRLGITTSHILPNLFARDVQATSRSPLAILAEAGLSYLARLPQPPTPPGARC